MAEHEPTSFRPEIARRNPELPTMQRAPVAPLPPSPETPAPARAVEEKTLIVGRNIELSGQITACDKLVVEGRVDATLTDCRAIEIAPTGVFKGSVEIEEAVIGGEFSGKVICRGRLQVRNTGKVHGEIRYGQIEIELGGELAGDVNTIDKPTKATSIAVPAIPAPEVQSRV